MDEWNVTVYISGMYILFIILLRMNTDASTESHKVLYRMVEYANEWYNESQSSSPHTKMKFASMSLAMYTMLADTEHMPRSTIDRIAQCDVIRRKRRLERTIADIVTQNVPIDRTKQTA
jgi:hypothetical protein